MKETTIEGLYPTKLWFDPANKNMASGFRIATIVKETDETTSKAQFKEINYQMDFTADYKDAVDGGVETLEELDFKDLKIRKYIGFTSELTDDHGLTEEEINNFKELAQERVAYQFTNNKNNRLSPL